MPFCRPVPRPPLWPFSPLKQYMRPVFHKDRQMTPKTVGWRLEKTLNQNKSLSGAEDLGFFFFMMKNIEITWASS